MKNTNQIQILNCSFDNLTKQDLLERFTSGVLIPTNVDMLITLQKDRSFWDCVKQGAFRVNDSQIIRFASFFLGTPLKDTISGSTFFPDFYTHHRGNPDVTIFLLGAKEGVAQTALERINAKVGRPIVLGQYSPPFGFELDKAECQKIIDRVNISKATVLAIGVGAPKQEKWIFAHKEKLDFVKMTLCIGATIDFEAGNVARAPAWIRRIGFEWLYRLYKEPKRLWRRYLLNDTPFFWFVLLQRLGLYRYKSEGAQQ